MIDKALVKKIVTEKLDNDMFVVDINVSKTNIIHIFVDGIKGITINQCIAISRHVEHSLDREKEDFELEVSSPGLTESFKVLQQYKKYTGKKIVVENTAGEKFEGLLKISNDESIVLETTKHERIEGHKKKQLVKKDYNINYKDIKSAKAVISFK